MSLVLLVLRRTIQSDAKNGFVKIGDIRVPIHHAKRPQNVPIGFADKNAPPAIVQTLKWLMQKDILKQDVFLLGVPGSLRSSVVFAYLELVNREFEYLPVTRDTTEADIKQRREILGGNALYSDLCAVRAALEGRVLIIDGVEKAERNVLPILNNLLENREMQLDDGRFLMAANKYDKLLEKYSETDLKRMKVERVSEDFHVVALGIPVPTFKGHTLDPPLRSRFQCRTLSELPFDTMSQLCSFLAPKVPADKVNSLLALVYGINSTQKESSSISLPLFPVDSLVRAVRIWNNNPSYTEEHIFGLSYPSGTLLNRENQLSVLTNFFDKFAISRNPNDVPTLRATTLDLRSGQPRAKVTLSTNSEPFEVEAGGSGYTSRRHDFVSTPQHEAVIADLLTTHSAADICLLGTRGSGKTTIIEEFASRLGYDVETVVLYQDMNSRELIQQRRMLPDGDTVWEDSQLVRSAKNGSLCVLDGIEKVHWSTVEMLSSLIHHRYLQLPDGTRLIGSFAFEALQKKTGESEALLAEKGVFKIAENFRIIALGDSESATSTRWLNDQLLSLFAFHTLPSMSVDEQCHVISRLVPGVDSAVSRKLVSFVEHLRASSDANIRSVAVSLSLRRLIYLLKRHTPNPSEGVFDAVHRAALSRFMPSVTKAAFDNALLDSVLVQDSTTDGSVIDRSWRERLASHSPEKGIESESMVPDIVFFDNKEHLRIMNNMASDFELGSHLLLIGNQGVGKNKVTDRFLQLINRPRQYMQLHRDTTVQSLTVQSTVVDGLLKHEDSPLVKAVKDGTVLVIDEADKAPLYVVAVLKSLLDSGVLYLSDGRRIQPPDMPVDENTVAIPVHPDFRMIMLANRPGFPFLGNDLFSVLGDLFSVHVVENPTHASELAMLQQYAPDVSIDRLNQLINVFGDLREMADNGLLSYPYSTRELVSIVKHLQSFPSDPVTAAIRNVFDFDAFSPDSKQAIEDVFHRHGIPFGVTNSAEKIYLAKRFPIPKLERLGRLAVNPSSIVTLEPIVSPVVAVNADTNNEYEGTSVPADIYHARVRNFTEQEFAWKLPLVDGDIASDIVHVGENICVASVNPPALWVIKHENGRSATHHINLSTYISRFLFANFKPRMKVAKWTDNSVLIHEELTNSLLILDFVNRYCWQLAPDVRKQSGGLGAVTARLSASTLSTDDNHWRLVSSPRPILFNKSGNEIRIYYPGELPAGVQIVKLPQGTEIVNVLPVDQDRILVTTTKGLHVLSLLEDGTATYGSVDSESVNLGEVLVAGRVAPPKTSDPVNMLLATSDYFSLQASDFPRKASGVLYGSRRPKLDRCVDSSIPDSVRKFHELVHPHKETIIFPSGIVVRALGKSVTPAAAITPDVDSRTISAFLEVTDTRLNSVQYVPVPAVRHHSYYSTWQSSLAKSPLFLVKAEDNKALYTCEVGTGIVRKWEVDEAHLTDSLHRWTGLLEGNDTNANERIEVQKSEDEIDMDKLNEPTLGRYDPENNAHQGGNQWMGGTGGFNTAGLGGVGGPFRLDAGHDVHQIHESAKGRIPQEILDKAREINRQEYNKRLKEINMSEHDAAGYERFKQKIAKPVTFLKNVIDSLEARQQERQWVKHQTSGDLDDGKLIEGMTGEKAIYRRRMDQTPEAGTPQTLPKRVSLVFDVSGSMYRFDGMDHRLMKSMETAMMVMEAFEGKGEKIRYDISGHSGEGPDHVFTTLENPPANEKQRMDVIKRMLLHSQFCWSGDTTIEGLSLSISRLAKETEVDERFSIILSDANLDRYSITPAQLTKTLQQDPTVHAFIIFVGSLGEQADFLVRHLPAGKAFYAKDTDQLPTIMQSIFASTLVK